MARAQGSLEYLIIISVVIAVVAIVSLIALNSFSSQQGRYVYNTCASAAASCKISLSANPDADCSFCDTSCSFSNGTEIFTSAATCCKQGRNDLIYDGSIGCMPACSDGTPYGECSETLPLYCNDGILVEKCTDPEGCYCPAGETCNADGTCSPPTDCGLILDGQCDPANPPWRCEDGTMVPRCDVCGCPDPTSGKPCCDGAKTECMCRTIFYCPGTRACESYKEYYDCNECGLGQCCDRAACVYSTFCPD